MPAVQCRQKPVSVSDLLRRESAGVLVGNFSDLEIDLAQIADNPKEPFLWFLRPLGTCFIRLPAPDSDYYPPAGVRVPYLFGDADREHMLGQFVKLTESCTNSFSSSVSAVYFDGVRGRVVSFSDAVAAVRAYAVRVRREWYGR